MKMHSRKQNTSDVNKTQRENEVGRKLILIFFKILLGTQEQAVHFLRFSFHN